MASELKGGHSKKVIKIVLENFPFAAAAGLPALCGLIGLIITAALFRRPYIAIAGGILGTLIGMGIIA